MPGIDIDTCTNSFNSHNTLSNRVSYPSFTDKKTETKEVKLDGEGHSGYVAELES